VRMVSSDSDPGNGEGARMAWSWRERADLMRVIVPAVMVCPALGEALTIVPGEKVGDGQGLVERKRGWMLFSLNGLYSHVELFELDCVGESMRIVDAVGEGIDGCTRLSKGSAVGGLRRRLGMLRMLCVPRRRGRVSRSGSVSGILSRVGDGLGEVCVEELLSMLAFFSSFVLVGQSVVSE
jgi:hypothetical protein